MSNLLSHVSADIGEVFLGALLDSALILPAVFLVHLLIAFIQRRSSGGLKRLKNGLSPLIGTAVGTLPQCGFGIASARLYTQRYISLGALAAVLIATSDEAIFIFASHSGGLAKLLPILIIKTVYALVAGYAITLVTAALTRKAAKAKAKKGGSIRVRTLAADDYHLFRYKKGVHSVPPAPENKDGFGMPSAPKRKGKHAEHNGCDCCGKAQTRLSAYLFHPLKHSLIIFAYCLIINIIIGLIIHLITPARLEAFMQTVVPLQPLLAGLIALIPTCAPALIISEMYLDGLLTLGATVAGLTVATGLGYAVLIKESKQKPVAILIVVCLFITGVMLGMGVDIVQKLL